MIDIYITHNDPDRNIWDSIPGELSPFVHILDIGSIKERSKAYKLKQEWAARQDPFCLVEEDGKAVKAFYSETGDDAINQLIKFMKIWKKK